MISELLIPHPYATCYPLMSGALEESLYESIKQNGLRQPVVLWRDEARDCVWIIDGRNRHRALSRLQGGLRPDQVVWHDYQNDEEVLLAVLDYNENRRQMSTSQKSVVAGRIMRARSSLIEVQRDVIEPAIEASRPSEPVPDAVPNAVSDDDPPFDPDPPQSQGDQALETDQAAPQPSRAPMPLPATSTFECPPEVRREVAATLGIGAKTAQKGAQVVGRGAPKLVDALEEGLVSVEAAYTLTRLEDDELEAVVNLGKDAMRAKAKELKQAARKERSPEPEPPPAEVEVSQMNLSWTERVGDESKRFDLELTDQDQLSAVLKLLDDLGARG